MSGTLVILCPGGRRVKVSTTPNMSLLAVQEAGCAKKGLDPGTLALEHRGKRLDISSTVRFSGLPNNATLDLVELKEEELEAQAGKKEQVTVCLQVGEERLVNTFLSSSSLGEVVARWGDKLGIMGEGEQPVLVYMRREMVGQKELDQTSLRTLGLTTGKGLFRFFYKQPQVLKSQANVFEIKEKKEAVEERPHIPMRLNPEIVTMATTDAMRECEDTLTSEHYKQEVEKRTENEVEMKPEIGSSASLETAFPKDTLDRDETTPKDPSPNMDLAPPLPDSSTSPVVQPVGPHGAIVFKAEGPGGASLGGENVMLDDEFFELSLEEAKGMYRDLKQEVKRLHEGDMLMTQQMREASKEGQKLGLVSRYKTGVLRVQLPCRHIAQGQFPPSTSIKEVVDWLRPLLDLPSLPCELYTAPPRTVLPLQETLLDLGLYPAALVHLSTNLSPREVPGSPGHYLSQEVLASLSNTTGANRVAADLRRAAVRAGRESTRGVQGELSVTRPYKRKLTPLEEEEGGTRPVQAKTSDSSGGTKVPRWFKTNK